MPLPGKRQNIIEAAVRVMSQQGAAGLTASSLAAAAGVSKANIFHHFQTLDDVVLAAFEQFLLGMQAFAPQPGTGLRGWLEALGAETVSLMDEQRVLAGAYFAFVSRAQSDERLRQRMAATAVAAEQVFAQAIQMLAPGRFTPREIKALAALIMMAGDGLAVHRHLFPERAAEQRAGWRSLIDHIAPEKTSSRAGRRLRQRADRRSRARRESG